MKKEAKKKRERIFSKSNSRGQIWVETVIYLLIAFVMIGLVLSFVKPKIEELRDRTIIEQSITILEDIDDVILNIGSAGNKRLMDIGIKRGDLKFDGANDEIYFEIESAYIYSEPGETIYFGDMNVTTEKKGKYYFITLKNDYSQAYNLTYKDKDETKTLTRASTPYTISISNEGKDASGKTIINFDLI